MTSPPLTTLDTIHVALERLGYVPTRFGGARAAAMLYGIYCRATETVVVSWPIGSTVYELAVGTAAVADVLRRELVDVGLTCQSAATRLYVHGQEHIDAEVRKMLG